MAAVPSEPEIHFPEEPDMQVKIDSHTWHRQCGDGLHTACGKPINYRMLLGARGNRYGGELCREGCFSDFELGLSEHENERNRL